MGLASYAMFWWFGEGPRLAGRVEVASDGVSLAATTPAAQVDRIRFADVGSVLLERGVMHVARAEKPTVHIGSLDAPGALTELARRFSGS